MLSRRKIYVPQFFLAAHYFYLSSFLHAYKEAYLSELSSLNIFLFAA